MLLRIIQSPRHVMHFLLSQNDSFADKCICWQRSLSTTSQKKNKFTVGGATETDFRIAQFPFYFAAAVWRGADQERNRCRSRQCRKTLPLLRLRAQGGCSVVITLWAGVSSTYKELLFISSVRHVTKVRTTTTASPCSAKIVLAAT